MLSRIAARAVSGRGAPHTFRSLSSTSSVIPYSHNPHRCAGFHQTRTITGFQPFLRSSRPTLSQWQIKSVRFESNRSQKPPPKPENDLPNQPEFTEEPRSNRPRKSNKLRPDAQSTFSSSEQPSEISPEEAPGPTKPLPDLTKGIPSTFEAEFSDKDKNSSFKEQEVENPSLNLTEDPAQSGSAHEEEARRKEEYISSIERRRNALARYLYISLATFILSGSLILGQDWDEEEAKKHPDVPGGWHPMAVYARIKARLSSTLGYYTEPAFPKLLPDLDASMKPPYTLVLSLEDLLISSRWNRQTGWEVAKRPGVDYFLRYMSQYYELVIFTSVQMMNADLVIRKLDPYHVVMWPLFREATRYMNGEHVKDLSYLNRDLSKTLIIDTVPGHVQLQPENAVVLPKWSGQPSDGHTKDLVAMIPFLEYIATMSVPDVRKFIQSFEGCEDIPAEFARREARAREAFQKKRAEEFGGKKRTGGRLGGLTSMLGLSSQPQIPGEQSPEEAFAQGKTLSDQYRERGIRNYQMLEKEIRENGEKWLQEMEAEEKKAQEEQMKSMQSGMSGMLDVRSWFGGGGGDNKDGSSKN